MSGWERKKARHRTGMYLDEKLSHRIFLLTTAPRHTLQAPLPGPFETKPPLAILPHLPMTRAARARQGRLQLVLGCRRWLQGVCDAMPEVMSSELPHAVSCARGQISLMMILGYLMGGTRKYLYFVVHVNT